MSEYLFSRRAFLGTAAVALTVGKASAVPAPVIIGSGKFTYTLDESWGVLPSPMKYGYGCAIVVDSQDRVYVTSRSVDPCVVVFDKDGKLLETWTKEFPAQVGMTPQQVAATAHGLYWSKEGANEYFYWTENVSAPKGGVKIGARVYKTDLKGKVLYELGNVLKPSDTAQKFDFTNPTDVAVAANGDIYVVDGYGSQLVHRFDKNFKHLKTIGGRGKDHGKFSTCHGVWVRTSGEVYIADRANNRLEVYSPELEYKRTIEDVRTPCCFYEREGHLFVPELSARVSVLDSADKWVARLGDGMGMKKDEIAKHPEKFSAPHALCLDSRGDLYVLEWLDFGRPRKFKHTSA